MRKTLENILFLECPILFSLGKMGMDAPRNMLYGICFGVQCDDGWYELIREACQKIEKINRENNLQITAHQIKEKFGTLRFYTGPVPTQYFDQVSEIIKVAEEKSAITCERCGNSGKLHTKGWWRTFCDPCYEKWQKERAGQFDDETTE